MAVSQVQCVPKTLCADAISLVYQLLEGIRIHAVVGLERCERALTIKSLVRVAETL